MTNEHYMEVAKECGFDMMTIAPSIIIDDEQLDAYTARICADKDAAHADEVKRLNDIVSIWKSAAQNADIAICKAREQLSAANAAIAMKDEALKAADEYLTARVSNHGIVGRTIVLPKVKEALSTSPESIAAWEAEKLLPLQRQVSMLSDIVALSLHCKTLDQQRDYNTIARNALSITQATAEAYDREHASKVLEDFAYKVKDANAGELSRYVELTDWLSMIFNEAAELRAANKKETKK